jgi:Heparinase II/III-like protein/Heparinase II/III N-terminus
MIAGTSLARTDELERPLIRPRLDPELTGRTLMDSLVGGRFTVHGETHVIGDPVDWFKNPSDDIEWHIVLHKFFHAPGLVQAFIETGDTTYLDLWKRHTLEWIAHVPPGFIAADVTGRRIRNWVYALTLFEDCAPEFADPAYVASVRLSLTEQTSWLKDNLHPARNHRTLELFAVFIAGVALFRPDWTHFALNALGDNAEADFLPDGVHVELSSHYHCIALRSLVEAAEIAADNGISLPPRLAQVTARAQHFARVLHKPDGKIPALGDADVGDYRNLFDAAPPPRAIEVFRNGGYVFLRDQAAVRGDRDGGYLVLDCGDIGAGNHGHLDCLSIEFAAFGRSLIVDPGRYTYFEGGDINERARFRGTGAHNLVQVDLREQTRYRQGPKRMKIDGPAPEMRLIEVRPGFVHAQAISREYDVVIERRIVMLDAGWWLIHDAMTAAELHDYDLCMQLSPETEGHARIIELPCGTPAAVSPNLLAVTLSSSSLTLSLEPSWVAPRYGFRVVAPRIRARQSGADAWFATLLVPFARQMPDVRFAAEGKRFRISLDGGISSQLVQPC